MTSAARFHLHRQLPVPAPYGLGALRQGRESMLDGVEDLRLGEDHPHLVGDALAGHPDFFPARDDPLGKVEALRCCREVHSEDDRAVELGCQ